MDDSMAESDYNMDASSDFEPPVKAPAVRIVPSLLPLSHPNFTSTIEEGCSCKEGSCTQGQSSSSQETNHSQTYQDDEGRHKEAADTDK